MANFFIPTPPVYNPNVRELENTDPADATVIFNPTLRPMVVNTAAVKVTADGAAANATTALGIAQGNAGDITSLDGRLTQLELEVENSLTANPFIVSFASLAGLTIANGIWNTTFRRMEC